MVLLTRGSNIKAAQGYNLFSETKISKLEPPVEARYLKFVPSKTDDNRPAAVRLEIFGNIK